MKWVGDEKKEDKNDHGDKAQKGNMIQLYNTSETKKAIWSHTSFHCQVLNKKVRHVDTYVCYFVFLLILSLFAFVFFFFLFVLFAFFFHLVLCIYLLFKLCCLTYPPSRNSS